MKDRCIQAVADAIGRDVSRKEADGIEARIAKNMRMAASRDPEAFRSMSPDERLKSAAQLAGKELVQEAEVKKRRIALTIQAHDRVENFLAQARSEGIKGIDALKRILVFVADGKSNTLSLESRRNAIRSDTVRQLIDTFEAVDPRIWGLFEDKEGVKALTRAIFGEKTGVAQIDKGAQAWLNTTRGLRETFNANGGKIGMLENWAVPQHHSQIKVAKVGAQAWMDAVFPLLDRAKYLREDGTRMDDGEVMGFLNEAWLSIATGGINQLEPGAAMGGMSVLANRRAQHREIHYKNADAYLQYQEQFGEKSLWGVMTGHVEALSRDIAALETFGPNPDRTFQVFLEKMLKADAMADPQKAAKAQSEAVKLQSLYDFQSGKTAPIANVWLAEKFDTLRNWMVALRLGSAVITALSDEATVHLTAKFNNLPEMQLLQNELAALNPANRREEMLAHRAGIAVDSMLSHLNRWGQDNLGATFSSQMANTVMRASGLEALDGARRRGFGVTMMSAIGEVVGKYSSIKNLDADDHRMLTTKGVTETDFQIWKAADLEKWGAGNGVLTPEAIMRIPAEKIEAAVAGDRARLIEERDAKIADIESSRAMIGDDAANASIADWQKLYGQQIDSLPQNARRDAVLRLLGVVGEETDMAVIRPGDMDRFRTGGGIERGTFKGELMRSFFQFKAFPLAMISRHWMRGWGGTKTAGGRAAYLGSLIVGTTVLGAVSQTISELLAGKDVRNYNPFEGEHGGKNWLAAFLKGGSLGLYGDFLFSSATQTSQTGPIAALMGPIAGSVEELYKLTLGNAYKEAQDKKVNWGGDLVRFIKGNTPGASLWYLKAALDHVIFQQAQEYFSPGYLARMERRTRQEFGQDYWWSPGAGVNGMRAPRLERALGK
jgi:hypothetical protein